MDSPVEKTNPAPLAPSKKFRVPFVNPVLHYRRLKKEIDRAIFDCLENGDLIHRRQLFDFEKHLAEYVGTKYAVGLNSGYHALHFALLAHNIGPGDEVITVAHTFAASVSAIVNCGATPVLVDVGADYNMNMAALEGAVTPRTRAIMPVHLNGRVCDMDPILELVRKHELVLVEDACQALGASYGGKRAGSFGAGCFSFYPFKALGGFGDGGAITTDDPDLAKFAVRMRYNGEDRETGEFHYHGHTALLDNVQAAVLDVKLKYFPDWIEHRRQIANRYREQLKDIPEITLPHFSGDEFFDSYQNYVIRAQDRDALRAHLTQEGVETLISWPKPLWHHARLKLGNPSLPFTELLCREVLSLPMSAETQDRDVEVTSAAIRGFYRRG